MSPSTHTAQSLSLSLSIYSIYIYIYIYRSTWPLPFILPFHCLTLPHFKAVNVLISLSGSIPNTAFGSPPYPALPALFRPGRAGWTQPGLCSYAFPLLSYKQIGVLHLWLGPDCISPLLPHCLSILSSQLWHFPFAFTPTASAFSISCSWRDPHLSVELLPADKPSIVSYSPHNTTWKGVYTHTFCMLVLWVHTTHTKPLHIYRQIHTHLHIYRHRRTSTDTTNIQTHPYTHTKTL
jgi:hypothetical protein